MEPNIPLATGSTSLGLSQNRVLRNTYLLLAIALVPTVIGAVVGVNSNFSFMRASPMMMTIGTERRRSARASSATFSTSNRDPKSSGGFLPSYFM